MFILPLDYGREPAGRLTLTPQMIRLSCSIAAAAAAAVHEPCFSAVGGKTSHVRWLLKSLSRSQYNLFCIRSSVLRRYLKIGLLRPLLPD